MISELTKEQTELIDIVKYEWLNRFYRLDKIDKEKAAMCIKRLYKYAGYDEPQVLFYDGSPVGAYIMLKAIERLSSNIRENIKANIKDNIEANIWANIGANIGENIRANIIDNIKDNIRANIDANIWDNIKENIGDNIMANVWANIGENIRDNIEDNIVENIEANILENIEANIEANIEDNIRANIMANIWDNIRDNIEDNIRDNIGDNIGDNIVDNIWANIRENIRDNIRANIDANILHNIRENMSYYIRLDDIYWCAYYNYYERAGLINYHNEQWNNYKELIKCNIGFSFVYKNVVMLSSLPTEVHQIDDNRLHNEHGMAIKFSDGWGIYALNGVVFPEELYLNVIQGMEMKDVLAIEDIDQRTQAIKYAKNGIREFYKEQNGNMIDNYVKLDKDGRPINYELWAIPAGNTFTKEVHFAVYECPSAKERGEKREYTKGVPAFCTVAEAMAWGMSNDEHVVTAEEWKGMVPLLDES